MAELIPTLNSCKKRMTGGERRFGERLQDKLEDDYYCWYDVPVGGARQLHPDFIILNPRRGLLILEVKDWKLDNLQRIDKLTATLTTARGPVKDKNPLAQARQYLMQALGILARDSALLHPEDHAHAGKLCFPYGYGAVLANITRKQFDGTDLGEALPAQKVICKDEMSESVDAEDFQKRLWDMFPYAFEHILTMPQIDRIRAIIFPEIRIPAQGALSFAAPGADPEPIPENDVVKVMDLKQERLARSLGAGHRIIHGVAGSGKTMILGYRCQHLARALNKPMLTLCYNVALAAKLRWMVSQYKLGGRVDVRHFHGWCNDQLRLYQLSAPAAGPDYAERLVQTIIDGVESGHIPRAQYASVLVDEGHDFEPEWFKLIVQMVDPDSNALLVLYDDAQSIYSKQRRLKFSFASVGIQARGRTTILDLNYRNTAEVLAVAYGFAKEILTPQQASEDGVPLIAPRSAKRRGKAPEIIKLGSFRDEIEYLVARLQALAENHTAWREIAIIYRSHFMGEAIARRLRAANIPVEWLHEDKSKRHYRPDAASLKLMTMHASKGLEFPLVIIPGLGYLPHPHGDPNDEARLLYVAMTRAMDRLLMTYHRDTVFTRRLGEQIEHIAA